MNVLLFTDVHRRMLGLRIDGGSRVEWGEESQYPKGVFLTADNADSLIDSFRQTLSAWELRPPADGESGITARKAQPDETPFGAALLQWDPDRVRVEPDGHPVGGITLDWKVAFTPAQARKVIAVLTQATSHMGRR